MTHRTRFSHAALRRSALAGCLALAPALSFGAAHLISPKDGDVVGPQPNLVFAVDEYNDKMKFSLEISKDRFKEDSQTWDMRRTLRGWTISSDAKGKPQGGDFLLPRPLGEGTWWWRVVVHDNGADTGPDFVASFVVDPVPPAEVDGVMAAKDKESGGVRLTWNPVALDTNGNSESVESYRIYCYDKRGIFPRGNLKLLGTSDRPTFIDPKGGKAAANSVSYYRITAVDSVGNESPPPKNPYYPEQTARERGHKKSETAAADAAAGTDATVATDGASPAPAKGRKKGRQPLIPKPQTDGQ